MSTFPIRDDEYSVEEISYEDMMLALSLQGANGTQTELVINEGREDDLARRLEENANRKLPDWLMNG